MRIPAAFGVGIVLLSAACCRVPKPVTGQDRRPGVDCDAEIAYQGIKTEGQAKVFDFGAMGSIQDAELRRCNDALQAYIAATTRICRQHNGGALPAEQYRTDTREQSLLLAAAVARLVDSVPPEKRKEALASADVAMSRVGGSPAVPLSFRLVVDATVPGTGTLVVPPNYPLPTGTEARFTFHVSRTAYVYVVSVSPSGKVDVLFPDKRGPMPNPLLASEVLTLPGPTHKYRFSDREFGPEKVFVVVSLRPVRELEATLKNIAEGKVDDVTQDPGLTQLAAMDSDRGCPRSCGFGLAKASESCVSSRGFKLAPAQGTSLEARAASGDDVVAKAFPFLHVSEAESQQRLEEYKAANPDSAKSGGRAVEK